MKRTTVLFSFLVLALLATLFSTYRWRQADSRLRHTVSWTHLVMDSLATTVTFPRPPYATGVRDTLYWQWVATTAEMRSRRAMEAVRHWVALRSTVLDEADIAQLKQQGLDDPPRQLRASLIAHPKLIPYPGELGGTMGFDEDSIVLLAPSFAFAEFDDGHVGGHMLLEYSVHPGAKIDWKVVWSSLY
jgi:hypothetical protein